MKIALSLPDQLLREADRHARHTGKSRSQLYAEAMNQVCETLPKKSDPFLKAVTQLILQKETW